MCHIFQQQLDTQKDNIMGIMKGQEMSLRGVINAFQMELPFFLCTRSCWRRGEEGEVVRNCDCYSLQHTLSAL